RWVRRAASSSTGATAGAGAGVWAGSTAGTAAGFAAARFRVVGALLAGFAVDLAVAGGLAVVRAGALRAGALRAVVSAAPLAAVLVAVVFAAVVMRVRRWRIFGAGGGTVSVWSLVSTLAAPVAYSVT
ncbi:MAG TPA: hypothetical protein VHH34_08950, partial [Pseudonocardiaceae bacterium]|nr:hypothetical protein [Pseudonocardiaceae bacterium]